MKDHPVEMGYAMILWIVLGIDYSRLYIGRKGYSLRVNNLLNCALRPFLPRIPWHVLL